MPQVVAHRVTTALSNVNWIQQQTHGPIHQQYQGHLFFFLRITFGSATNARHSLHKNIVWPYRELRVVPFKFYVIHVRASIVNYSKKTTQNCTILCNILLAEDVGQWQVVMTKENKPSICTKCGECIKSLNDYWLFKTGSAVCSNSEDGGLIILRNSYTQLPHYMT